MLGVMVLAALSAGAIGLGAFALDDIDVSPSQEAGVAGLSSPPQSPGEVSRKSAELDALNAGLAALADFESPTPTPTQTPPAISTPTATAVPPTATEPPPTETPIPPTDTPPPPPTDTPEPPTETPVPPTEAPVPPTPTPEPPTVTPTLDIPQDVPLLGEYVPPTATPQPPATTATVPATATPSVPGGPVDPDAQVTSYATRYADSLEGNQMACGGTFDQENAFIVAVSLKYDHVWPCGTQLEVCGAAGCMVGVRTDTCPGCPGADIDVSRAGLQAVCGNQDGCVVTIQKLQ